MAGFLQPTPDNLRRDAAFARRLSEKDVASNRAIGDRADPRGASHRDSRPCLRGPDPSAQPGRIPDDVRTRPAAGSPCLDRGQRRRPSDPISEWIIRKSYDAARRVRHGDRRRRPHRRQWRRLQHDRRLSQDARRVRLQPAHLCPRPGLDPRFRGPQAAAWPARGRRRPPKNAPSAERRSSILCGRDGSRATGKRRSKRQPPFSLAASA
jgi:hypothetical protein